MLTVRQLLLDRVRVQLNDMVAGGVQWSDWELIVWLNEAMAEITRIRPEAHSETADLALGKGAKQQLPVDARMLLECICNIDADGEESTTVYRDDINLLNDANRHWMSGQRKALVKRYAASVNDPETFYTYPPNDGTGTLRAVVAKWPTELAYDRSDSTVADATLDGAFPLKPEYASPATNYVLYRCLATLIDDDQMQSRSAALYAQFEKQMGISNQVAAAINAETRDVR